MSVDPAQDVELGLTSDIKGKLFCCGESALEHHAGAVCIGLVVVIKSAGKPGKELVPRQDHHAHEIRHRSAFVLLRPHEAHPFHCSDSEQLGAPCHLRKACDRDGVRLRYSMDVDIGCKAIFDAAADQLAFQLSNQFRIGHEKLLVPEERGGGAISGATYAVCSLSPLVGVPATLASWGGVTGRGSYRVCGTVVPQFH